MRVLRKAPMPCRNERANGCGNKKRAQIFEAQEFSGEQVWVMSRSVLLVIRVRAIALSRDGKKLVGILGHLLFRRRRCETVVC